MGAAETVDQELGLRERKKLRTRALISTTARRLFSRRGFEHVTIAEVAQAAEVSEQTVFNYFPRKEDLVYGELEVFEEKLLGAVRERAAGVSVLGAFGEFILEQRGLLAESDPAARKELTALTKMIVASPALLAREREIFARYTDALAELIADERSAKPGDAGPWVVANALIGAHRSVVDFTRARIVAGESGPRLARRVRAHARRALDLLSEGLGGYAIK